MRRPSKPQRLRWYLHKRRLLRCASSKRLQTVRLRSCKRTSTASVVTRCCCLLSFKQPLRASVN